VSRRLVADDEATIVEALEATYGLVTWPGRSRQFDLVVGSSNAEEPWDVAR